MADEAPNGRSHAFDETFPAVKRNPNPGRFIDQLRRTTVIGNDRSDAQCHRFGNNGTAGASFDLFQDARPNARPLFGGSS